MSRDPEPQATDVTIAATGELDDNANANAIAGSGPRSRRMPESVGRFTLDRRLGAGGMGVVYEGHDPSLGRKVAIKVLHNDTGAQARLLREAQALAQLTHENVVQVFEIDTSANDQVFIAMQFIEGRTLGNWLAERPRDWREIVDMFAGAGAGLVAAHAKGIVHRDFKPDNVLVGTDEVPRVLDFGLARATSTTGSQPRLGANIRTGSQTPTTAVPEPASPNGSTATKLEHALGTSPLSADLTRTGSIMGTPAYMSPEQASGLTVGAASDQFSFCVALYEALYGYRPFAGANIGALVANLLAGQLRAPPSDSLVPQWLHAALVRGLSPNPEDRFESIEALLTELGSYRTANLQVGSKARVAFLLVALLVLAGALGGNVIVVRLFDVTVTPGSTLPGSVVAIFVLLGALLAMRKELRRSGLNEGIFGCFVAYVFYGPSIRFAAWRMDLSMDQMMPLEVIGGSLAAITFAWGFDRRMLWPAFAFYVSALACLAIPSRALEFHALGHLSYFGYLCWIWYRDGMPRSRPSG